MQQYIVRANFSIKEALVSLNNIAHDVLTLFVVDETNRMVGTLSDGDIRRGLISGAQLLDEVCSIMHRDFKFIKKSEYNVSMLRKFRDSKILYIPILDEDFHIVDIVNLQKYKSQLPIDAVLMAGGKGERLRPLTEKTPKPLLLVGDKCIIDHNVDRLISYGIDHINVTVNYLGEQLEEHYKQLHNGVKVKTFREPKFLGTIGSVKFVDTYYNDTVLVMNSDLFTNIDYEDFYLHFISHDADMSIAAVPYNVSIPYGILELDGRIVKGVAEKPKYNYYANAGIYLIRKKALDEIPDNEFFNATDLIDKLISQNKKVIRYPLNGTWFDIGTPTEYQKALDFVKHI